MRASRIEEPVAGQRRILDMRLLAVLLASHTISRAEDAAAIMSKVAANLESAQQARRQYVYQQRVKARLIRANGRMARKEDHEYTVVPGPERMDKKLVSFAGEYHKNREEIVRYGEPGFEKGGMDIDGALIKDLVNDLVNNEKSRDGIPHSLFPLKSKDLSGYTFIYRDSFEFKARKTHRIGFAPSGKGRCVNIGGDDDCSTRAWKGEALVDAEEYQPVQIRSDLDFKMPWGVKVFLGTNLRQTGFSVSYTRVAPGVWFPHSYGTEFRLDVLFRYKRVITLAMDAGEFRKADAVSEVRYAVPEN